eukprot:6417048-Prymnesium_polylepis.1
MADRQAASAMHTPVCEHAGTWPYHTLGVVSGRGQLCPMPEESVWSTPSPGRTTTLTSLAWCRAAAIQRRRMDAGGGHVRRERDVRQSPEGR